MSRVSEEIHLGGKVRGELLPQLYELTRDLCEFEDETLEDASEASFLAILNDGGWFSRTDYDSKGDTFEELMAFCRIEAIPFDYYWWSADECDSGVTMGRWYEETVSWREQDAPTEGWIGAICVRVCDLVDIVADLRGEYRHRDVTDTCLALLVEHLAAVALVDIPILPPFEIVRRDDAEFTADGLPSDGVSDP